MTTLHDLESFARLLAVMAAAAFSAAVASVQLAWLLLRPRPHLNPLEH